MVLLLSTKGKSKSLKPTYNTSVKVLVNYQVIYCLTVMNLLVAEWIEGTDLTIGKMLFCVVVSNNHDKLLHSVVQQM
jgi:hypothetical protein